MCFSLQRHTVFALVRAMPLIRPATARDAAAIAHVHVQSWQSTYAGIVPELFLQSLSEADRTVQWTAWLQLDVPVFVAETNGNVVGFASGGPIREPLAGFDAELFAIYLLDFAQHQGTGTSLLQTLAQALIRRDLRSMIAWVLERNHSRYFYEATGAQPVERKQIEIGSVFLPAQAYGWSSLTALANNGPQLP